MRERERFLKPEEYQRKLDRKAEIAHKYIKNKLGVLAKDDIEKDIQMFLTINPGICGFNSVKGKHASRAVAKFLYRFKIRVAQELGEKRLS